MRCVAANEILRLICLLLELGPGKGFSMITEFEEIRKSCHLQHHCSHYATILHDFDLYNEQGKKLCGTKDLDDHPFGEWPRIIRTYSRTCPVAVTLFTGFDHYLKDYLGQNQLRLLGVAPAIKIKQSELYYFAAIFIGDQNSPDIECQNRNCTESECQRTSNIDIHARALHPSQCQRLNL